MCRLLKFLSVVGFALFIVSNVLFIWIQERPQSQCTCDCERVPVQIKGCQAKCVCVKCQDHFILHINVLILIVNHLLKM